MPFSNLLDPGTCSIVTLAIVTVFFLVKSEENKLQKKYFQFTCFNCKDLLLTSLKTVEGKSMAHTAFCTMDSFP